MSLVSSLFSFDSISIDTRVKKTFALAVKAIQEGAASSLTAIGRQISNYVGISEKDAIKRIDRLVGNKQLPCIREVFYSQFCCYFASMKNPLILVDWAHVDDNRWCLLRASIAFDGRAFTLYEQLYPQNKMACPQCHIEFLNALKSLLPEPCQPVICTDAGFKVPWFQEVEKLGWYWVGRVRGTVKLSFDGGNSWESLQTVYARKVEKTHPLPDMLMSKEHKFSARAVLHGGKVQTQEEESETEETEKKEKKKPPRPNCNEYKRHKQASEDPWLLASNVPKEVFTDVNIVNFYKRRMTIEESFRDSKNEYYGLGLRRCKSTTIPRVQVILLILLVAQWELYIIGRAAENKGLQRFYQANTTRHRRVLSYCFLARRILSRSQCDLTHEELMEAFRQLIEIASMGKETYGDP